MKIAALFAALSLSTCAATTSDWPMLFAGPDRNAISAETNLPALFVPGTMHLDDTNAPAHPTNLKWRTRLHTHSYGGPVAAGGKIFIGTDDERKGGLVAALDAATGRIIWQISIPRFQTKLPQFNYDDLDLGICSTPTIESNRLYLVSNRGELLCLDTEGLANGNDGPFQDEAAYIAGANHPPATLDDATGDIVWVLDMLGDDLVHCWPQDATSCSPILLGDTVYVCPSDGVDKSHKSVPHPDTPSLLAVDKLTGRLLARDREYICHRIFHGEWSSPTLGQVNGKTLLFYGGGDGDCYAFDPVPLPPAAEEKLGTLKSVWRFDVNAAVGRRGAYRTESGPSEIIATPVFQSGRVYIAGGQDPRHKEGRGGLACIDATRTGDLTAGGGIWVNTELDRSLTTVAIQNGLLFTADFSGQIFCMDAATGRTCWKYETHRPIWSSPLLADGKVYIGTDAGDLYVFAASREMNLLGRTKLESPISASPIAVNGVLYVLTQRWLYAVAAGADAAE